MYSDARSLLSQVETAHDVEWLLGADRKMRGGMFERLDELFDRSLRIYHSFDFLASEFDTQHRAWLKIANQLGVSLNTRQSAPELGKALNKMSGCVPGSLTYESAEALHEVLRLNTRPNERCSFAHWIGFPDSIVGRRAHPHMRLPGRDYNVLEGPLAGALCTFSVTSYAFQSASLWWPAEHNWVVSTDVDSYWTDVWCDPPCMAVLLESRKFVAYQQVESDADR